MRQIHQWNRSGKHPSNLQTRIVGLTIFRGSILFILIAIANQGYALAQEVPQWLKQASANPAPTQDRRVPALVLLNEQSIRVEEDGKVVTVERGAMRILTGEGRKVAGASLLYMTDTGKVKDFRAWLVRSSGEVKKYDKNEVADVAVSPNDVYGDVRRRVILATDDAEPGALFGYEWTMEDRSVFTQFEFQFQNNLPTMLSRFAIILPTGWRAEGVTFNRPPIEPSVNGSAYSWELRDLPFIEEEPSAPPLTQIAPRLAVSYFPSPGKSNAAASFDSWQTVSKWLTTLSESQATLDDALAGKARQLIANAKTEYEKIQAIGRFVQKINYVSIQTGVGRGGGYRPHSAIEVFAKSYGDCKDKANLMRAMLRAINIPSYLVCIYSGDPTYVREEWPSPQQFNHCIIAIKVSEETKSPTIVNHAKLGHLLIFDPTDDTTPVGDLPDHEQGSLALLIAGEDGALLRMPVTPPEANLMERNVDASLAADGSIQVNVRERSTGQAAVNERRAFLGLPRSDYVKLVEGWIMRSVSGASITKVEPADDLMAGRFSLDVEFNAPRYGQVMSGRLLVFKPALVSRGEALALTNPTRRRAIMLESEAYTERAKIKLPEGLSVDEMPDPVKLDVPFGSYVTSYEVKDGHLHFYRSLTVRNVIIPPTQYEAVKKFFSAVRSAEQSPVVLMRK